MNKNVYIKVNDYSVSGEEFELIHNSELDYLETFPKPSLEKLSEYYESEDYISHTNTKRNLLEKVYHLVRNYSLNRKLKLINSFNSEQKKLLDIGCGTGAFLNIAKNNNWDIIGIEPDDKARKIANVLTGNLVYSPEKISKLKEKSFDVITLWHVLEHLPNLEEQLSILKKLLKDNGTLIIAVPNYKSFDAKYYKNFWAAFDVPRHLWHFSQKSISNLFAKQNMNVVKTKPMLFDAFYVSLLSEKYKSKSMNPLKAFYIGIKSNLKAKQSGEYSSLIYIIKNNNF
ncbi:class I SAM-dependent methyltransferase [uncultured Lacinutrix sp.]|uniref:class I SAM-dependent methyltransferase n=1 Tax=uncultured Lacinutrix sp. TaxID=574032 RepID=UPI002613013D|nr:class I SAM-dependent methyltransferase [uncultured Lacinutrix sp.]